MGAEEVLTSSGGDEVVVEPVDDGVDVVLVLLSRFVVVAGGVACHVLRV